MNLAEPGLEKNSKVQLIIEAAQHRFGIFGIEKTSMREIADDLKLSKAALYYYFPDKESLYKAVIEKEQHEFIANINIKVKEIEDPEIFLREYASNRLSYFRKLMNLSRLRLEAYSDLRPLIRDTLSLFRKKEKEIIMEVFEKGIIKGVFSIEDADQTASLFLDLLKCLRISVVNEKKSLFIEEEEYEKLLGNTIAFTDIFIKGIKIK
jgi:AcrR family transcriptional regulator